MTTYTIPAEQILAELHRIARRHHLSIKVHRFPPPHRTPYRWLLEITDDASGSPVFGVAMEEARELGDAITDAWRAFLSWGIA